LKLQGLLSVSLAFSLVLTSCLGVQSKTTVIPKNSQTDSSSKPSDNSNGSALFNSPNDDQSSASSSAKNENIEDLEAQLAKARSGKPEAQARALFNLAKAYGEARKFDQAEQYYREALAIDRKLGKPSDIFEDIVSIALVQSFAKKFDLAEATYLEALADAKAKSREDLANVMNRAIYSGNDSNPVITTQLTAANKANNEFMDKLGQNILNNNTVLSQEDLKKREADNLYKNMVYMNKANFANDMTQLRQDALAKQAEYMNDKLAKEKELVYIGQMPVNQRNEYFKNVFGSKMRLGNKKKYGGKISKKKFL